VFSPTKRADEDTASYETRHQSSAQHLAILSPHPDPREGQTAASLKSIVPRRTPIVWVPRATASSSFSALTSALCSTPSISREKPRQMRMPRKSVAHFAQSAAIDVPHREPGQSSSVSRFVPYRFNMAHLMLRLLISFHLLLGSPNACLKQQAISIWPFSR
jgi:hypothetical protein